MPTYTIVDSGKDPLGPNEINAGGFVTVADGDVFIFDPTVDANVTFEYAGAGVPNIEIQINATQGSSYNIKIDDAIGTTVDIADNVDASGVKLDAKNADTVDFTAGNGVSFGQFDGALAGVSTVTLGDDFTTTSNWKFGSDDDIVIVGDNAIMRDFDMGDGNDVLTFGNDADLNNVDTKGGDDVLTFGMGLTAGEVKGSEGDDIFNVGANAAVNKFDGAGDNDTVNTKSPLETYDNFENFNIVCFADGTSIETRDGPVEVQNLSVGQKVWTADNGFQPLRWVGNTQVTAAQQLANPSLRPIRIAAGALGDGIPARDLFVSPNHRILVRSAISKRMFGADEVLIAAKKLIPLPDVQSVIRPKGVQYFHVLLDRHEVLMSNGAMSESLYLGAQARTTLGQEDAIQDRLPRRAKDDGFHDDPTMTPARPMIQKGKQIARLCARHVANKKPLCTYGVPAQRPVSDHRLLRAG